MELQNDLILKFSQVGATKFLEKIKLKIPQYYTDNGRKFNPKTEPEDWKDIDKFTRQKGIKKVSKLFYEEIYLFAKHGEDKHSGEVKLFTLEGVFKEFFDDEYDIIMDSIEKAKLLEETDEGIDLCDYGQILHKSTKEWQMKISKVPVEIINKDWCLYSYWEENELDKFKQTTGRKRRGILQSYLKFEENKLTLYYMDRNDNIEKFVGKAHSFIANNQLYIETELMPLGHNRWVRLLLLFGKELQKLALGLFYNFGEEGSLFSGSAILLNDADINGTEIQTKNCILHYTTSSTTLNHFFERRSHNYIKLPRIVDYNLTNLQEKLSSLLAKSTPKDIRIYKHDCFMSVPLSYIEQGMAEYDKNKRFCLETVSLLKKYFKFDAHYFACENYDFKTYEDILRETHYQDSMEGIAESQLFVMLLPNMQLPSNTPEHSAVRLSSVWAELGYAIGLRKPILILCDKTFQDKLPNIVNALDNQIMVATPDMYDTERMQSWFEIEVNRLDIEKFLKENRVS